MRTIESIIGSDEPKIDYFEGMNIEQKVSFIHDELTRYGCPNGFIIRIISEHELIEQFVKWYNYFTFKHSGDALPPSYIGKRNSFNYWLGSYQYFEASGKRALDHSAYKHRDEKNRINIK